MFAATSHAVAIERQHAFQLVQDVVKVPEHRILKLAQTRWLSRAKVVSRKLQQWDALH